MFKSGADGLLSGPEAKLAVVGAIMARNGRRYRKSFQQRSLESPLRVASGRFELAAEDDLITGNCRVYLK